MFTAKPPRDVRTTQTPPDRVITVPAVLSWLLAVFLFIVLCFATVHAAAFSFMYIQRENHRALLVRTNQVADLLGESEAAAYFARQTR